jgi:hypothetical protein
MLLNVLYLSRERIFLLLLELTTDEKELICWAKKLKAEQTTCLTMLFMEEIELCTRTRTYLTVSM